jgi:phospholipid/cholesterol/gamma-HCH transport system substrate-binding protein
LLTKANILFRALDLDHIHVLLTNMSAAFAGNDDAIDSLAVTAGLTAKVVHDDKQLLTTLFGNVSTFTTNLGELNAGEIISQTGKLMPRSIPAFLRLIHEIDTLSHSGMGVLGPDDTAGVVVTKLGEYLDMLSGPLSTFATVLQPALAPLRPVKVDAGHWIDFWESTFNDNGSLRVQLNVPEWHQ